jgi:hypothetical protein
MNAIGRAYILTSFALTAAAVGAAEEEWFS